jgi:hypothetical protein
MPKNQFGRRLSRAFKSFGAPLLLLFALTYPANPDFWSLPNNSKPETVKLVRKLPPVSARNGNTVRFEPEIAGNSVPAEVATILKEKIRTLLLNAKAGSIQLVDGPADTVIKCIVTEYELKVVHPGTRKVGLNNQNIVTWTGNIGASVQVLDSHGHPIDSAELKNHQENDFVVSEKEDQVTPVTQKKKSWRDQIAQGIKIAKGGDAGDAVKAAGGGQQMHDALAADNKGSRPPTDGEWRDALIEGMAAKVANRIVPVDQEFVAILPLDKEFTQIRQLAQSGRWGNVLEETDKMGTLSGANEAYRLYMLGLGNEATAYQDASGPDQAVELLNKATKYYDDAHKVKAGEREIFLAQIRAQDSLDHYLEIQHYLQNHPAQQLTEKTTSNPPVASHDPEAADNAALIKLANLPESIQLAFIQRAKDPKFDVSATGLVQLAQANVKETVINAVMKKMDSLSNSTTTQAPSKRVASAKPVQ